MTKDRRSRFEKFLDNLMPDDPAVDLSGSGWKLTALNGEPLLPRTSITLEFVDDDHAAGSAGCNNYTTTYTQIEGTPALSFGEVAMTMKACAEPVMEQERAYLQVLAAVTGFRVAERTLSLTDAGDETVAAFDYVSQDLADSAWVVESYNNGRGGVVSLVSGTSLTAKFSADGKVSGSAGCNNYSGSYEADGDAISFGPLASTRKMCIGEGVMEQEAAFLAAMATVAVYNISGDRLELRREDGALAVSLRRA